MNKLNFNQSIGFPLDTEILDEMQNAYSVFNLLGDIVGNLGIISGCTTVGPNATNGCVYINGEVFLFQGGPVQTTVIIKEDIEQLEFEDANSNDVIYRRYVTFGVGVGQLNWADFKQGFKTKDIPEALDLKEDKTTIELLIQRIEDLESRPLANVPVGMIAIWGQALNLIPAGWIEYVDLRGKMPIGQDPAYDGTTNGDFINYNLNVLGTAAGTRQRKISASELPAKLNTSKPYAVGGTTNDYLSPDTTNNPLSIMNPYRVVHFIKYTGV